MMWILFILMGAMTAGVTLALGGRGKLCVLIPCLSLALYFLLGSPDMPGQSAAASARPDMLLAERPLATLRQNPGDIGALLVMGDLSLRLHEPKKAAASYVRAVRAARTQNDPRL